MFIGLSPIAWWLYDYRIAIKQVLLGPVVPEFSGERALKRGAVNAVATNISCQMHAPSVMIYKAYGAGFSVECTYGIRLPSIRP